MKLLHLLLIFPIAVSAADGKTTCNPVENTAAFQVTAPFEETFTGGSRPALWTESGTDFYQFSLNAGYTAEFIGDGTPSGGTNYAWIDASAPNPTTSTLTGPGVDISGLSALESTFSFKIYSHYDPAINGQGSIITYNTVTAEVFTGSTWVQVYQNQGSLGNQWNEIVIDLNNYTLTSNNINFRFTIVTNGSPAFYNDILIDDVGVGAVSFINLPYLDDFEGIYSGAWKSGGSASSWQEGTPSGSVITDAASGQNAWVTNLSGNYNSNEASTLESVRLDCSSLNTDPGIAFKFQYETETFFDGLVLQSSTDNGSSWQNVGSVSSGTNWFNANFVVSGPGGQNVGWSGSSPAATMPGNYVVASNTLTGLAGEANVRLRFAFSSDGSNQEEGAAIDDMIIGLPSTLNITSITGTPVADGDTNPTVSKGTDYGSKAVGSSTKNIFLLSNTGSNDVETFATEAVTITGPGASAFLVATSPNQNIAAGNTVPFSIDFAPSTPGVYNATVTVKNSSINNSFYTFQVTGTAASPAGSNDDIASATILTFNAPCTGSTYGTSGDTFESGETVPAYLTPLGHTGSQWFSFTAPSSGNALVYTSNHSDRTLSIAAYELTGAMVSVSALGSSLDASHGFTGGAIPGIQSFIDLDGLTPGDTYYIQVLSNASTNFCIEAIDPQIHFWNGTGWTGGSPATSTNPYARVEVLTGNAILNANNGPAAAPIGYIKVAAGASLHLQNNTGLLNYGKIQVEGTMICDADSGLVTAVTGNTFQSGNTIQVGGLLLYNEFTWFSFGSEVQILNALSVLNDLNSNGNLTFASTPARTGVFAARENLGNGNFKSINGDVTVHRSLPKTNGLTGRAFRFIGTSVTSSGTIFENWQEGGSSPPGFGTYITGSVGSLGTIALSGLDQTPTGEPSLFRWSNDNLQSWNTVNSTDLAGDILQPADAYRIWIRGDRNLNLGNTIQPSNNTALRSTGSLQTTAFSRSYDVDGGDFVMVANPFQNALDLQELMDRSTNVVDDLVYHWDPTLGGSNGYGAYVTYTGFDGPGTGSGMPSSSNNDYLQPGQAVFVVASAGANGPTNNLTMSFDPVDTDRNFLVTGAPNTVFSVETTPEIYIELWDSNALENGLGVNDATRLRFDGDTADLEGPLKLFNPGESIAIKNDGEHLALASVQKPDDQTLIPLFLYRLSLEEYVLRLKVSDLDAATAYLEDRSTGERTELVDGWNNISFTPDISSGTTDMADRFAISFGSKSALPAEGTQAGFAKAITLYPNPVTDGQLFLQLPKEMDEATVTITNMLGQTVSKSKIANSSATGNLLDVYGLIPGIYHVKVSGKEIEHLQKLVIQ